jgi:two-component system cell cycle response regulator
MGATVLVVEDEAIIGQDIRRILTGFGYDVPEVATSARDALRAVEARVPDLVLMDIKIKGPLDGVQTATRLRDLHDVPIVFLTSHSDEATLARAKATSPYGYIVKPFTDRGLRTCIEIALARRELESKASAESDRLVAALVARDEQHAHESVRILAAARTDPLTEAGNRLRLQEDLEGIIDRSQRYGHSYCAAFCDIDGFKGYNDTFGHLAGDATIRVVSQTIHQQLRRGDSFYRYGGDEFLVLLPEQTRAGAAECMERVRVAVAAIPLETDGGVLARRITISIGIAELRCIPGRDAIQSWLQEADAALYRAKERGRNCSEVAE